MANTEFIENLRRLKQLREGEKKQLGPWQAAARAQFEAIKGWLKPAQEEGLLTVQETGRYCLVDEDFNYELPALELRAPGVFPLNLVPVGLVLGAGPEGGRMGRIDLECGTLTVRLLWTADGWKLSRPSREAGRGWTYESLDENSFLSLLAELLGDPEAAWHDDEH